jgi:hypothetical protein
VIVGIVVGIVSLLIGVGLILFLILFINKRRRRRRKQTKNVSLGSEEQNAITSTQQDWNSVTDTQFSTPKQSELLLSTQSASRTSQISFNDLVAENEIGFGSYGRVCVGKWHAASVALKFCRNPRKLEEFVEEMKLMM